MPNEPVLEKREWMYCQKPAVYGIRGCACGNNECEYSEYKDHLWCAKCKKDFVPSHWGVFDGPILVQACEMLGMFFHRIDLKTNRLQLFMPDKINEAGEHEMVDVNLKPEELAVLKRFFVETAKQPEQKESP
jgi:hypothetical protein